MSDKNTNKDRRTGPSGRIHIEEAVAMRLAGSSLAELGAHFGVSGEAVRQKLSRWRPEVKSKWGGSKKGPQIAIVCATCEKHFEVSFSHKKRRFCSYPCYTKSRPPASPEEVRARAARYASRWRKKVGNDPRYIAATKMRNAQLHIRVHDRIGILLTDFDKNGVYLGNGKRPRRPRREPSLSK